MSSPPELPPASLGLFGRWNRRFPSAGHLSLALLALGAATGVALVAGYDAGAPAKSLALLELTSPAGRLLRSLHAWSGHLLLLFALLHAFEHALERSEKRARPAAWTRMVLLGPLLLALMLSGFVLRGDAEGELAWQVLSGLLVRLPGGEGWSAALLGPRGDLQLVTLHHAATLTLLVLFLAVEHARRFWPSGPALAGALGGALLGALVVPAGLHDGIDPVVKGPWYFVGMQELLHWLSHPGWAWLVGAVPVAGWWLLRQVEGRRRRALLLSLATLLGAYALVGAFAQLFRGAGWTLRFPSAGPRGSRGGASLRPPPPWAALDERKIRLAGGGVEGCLGCHDGVSGIEAAHDPRALGCASCHLGNPFAADAGAAHSGLVRVPGNLDSAELTCGRSGCHPEQVTRVRGSLMATLRGMIAVDRWALGERTAPDGAGTVSSLGSSPADTHLKELCIECHLGTLKERPEPATEESRGGGCLACHLVENGRRDYAPRSAPRSAARFAHPKLSLKVSDDRCLGCHSRSARISLSYAGWWDQGLTEEEAARLPAGSWRKLEDGRFLSRSTADVHFEKGMGCVDCHLSGEVMGDGKAYLHEEQATRVRCATCHRTREPRVAPVRRLASGQSAAVKAHLGESAPAFLLAEDSTGEVFTNAWPGGALRVEMVGKGDRKRRVANPPGPECVAVAGHERLSCESCHSPWVTTCTSCHTQWDPRGIPAGEGFGSRRRGAWVEYEGKPRLDAPALGVLSRDGTSTIVPVAPGMVMTVGLPGPSVPDPLPRSAESLRGEPARFLRAWALAVPHTTTKASRSCASCHRDPYALGYGRGVLSLEKEEGRWRWRFEPDLVDSPRDGLPLDAWVPFEGPGGGVATRRELSPLEPDARLRSLAVGACFPCHDPASAAGNRLYGSFRESLRRAGPRCQVPPSPEPAR